MNETTAKKTTSGRSGLSVNCQSTRAYQDLLTIESSDFLRNLVRPARLERATSWFVARRSIQLSYGRDRITILAWDQGGSKEGL